MTDRRASSASIPPPSASMKKRCVFTPVRPSVIACSWAFWNVKRVVQRAGDQVRQRAQEAAAPLRRTRYDSRGLHVRARRGVDRRKGAATRSRRRNLPGSGSPAAGTWQVAQPRTSGPCAQPVPPGSPRAPGGGPALPAPARLPPGSQLPCLRNPAGRCRYDRRAGCPSSSPAIFESISSGLSVVMAFREMLFSSVRWRDFGLFLPEQIARFRWRWSLRWPERASSPDGSSSKHRSCGLCTTITPMARS